jgi:MFS family permease
VRGLLRLYVPPLPRSVFTLQLGGLVNAFGNGMVVPFMFIYLHNVRGIDLGVAGLVIATHAVFSIVTGPIFGSQIDRFGGKRMLALSLVILSVGYASYALVQTPWQGFLVAVVSGTGVGGFWPSQSTLITGLTPSELRPAAFAMQRVV